MSDHQQFLARQCAFSRQAFGPAERTQGVLDHIRQEIEEVEKEKTAERRAEEWCDLVLLAQDGLLRAVRETLRYSLTTCKNNEVTISGGKIIARKGEPTTDYVAEAALQMLTAKRDKNELRNWPDWRTAPEDKAINHEEGTHD